MSKKFENTSLDNLDLDNMSISQIPERSSPDGGEVEETIKISSSAANKDEDSEAWSDWEELHDSQSHADKNSKNQIVSDLLSIINKSKDSESKEASLNSDNAIKSKTSQGFGEEYDIMAIKVKKKHDSELDLFADIEPKFEVKKFDLESLLEDANDKIIKPRERVPSLSATLACLDTDVAVEGEGWGVEDSWADQDLSNEGSPKKLGKENSSDEPSSKNVDNVKILDNFSENEQILNVKLDENNEITCNKSTSLHENWETNNWEDDF